MENLLHTGILYVHLNSGKEKGEALKEHILKYIAPHWFDERIPEIQEENHQLVAHLQQAITDHNERIQAIHYQNVGLHSCLAKMPCGLS